MFVPKNITMDQMREVLNAWIHIGSINVQNFDVLTPEAKDKLQADVNTINANWAIIYPEFQKLFPKLNEQAAPKPATGTDEALILDLEAKLASVLACEARYSDSQFDIPPCRQNLITQFNDFKSSLFNEQQTLTEFVNNGKYVDKIIAIIKTVNEFVERCTDDPSILTHPEFSYSTEPIIDLVVAIGR